MCIRRVSCCGSLWGDLVSLLLGLCIRRVSCCGSLWGDLVSLVLEECIRRVSVAGLYRVILFLWYWMSV